MRRLLLILGVELVAAALILVAAAAAPFPQSAVRWAVRDLGGGSYSGTAYAVNERGQIFGVASKRTAAGAGQNAFTFLWQNGRLRDLRTPAGAVAINERGQVLGMSQKTDDKGDVVSAQLWLWQAGHVRTILTSSVGISGLALNDRGQVMGNIGSGPDRAFFWQEGKLARIGGPGTTVRGLNNRGQVVGYNEDGARAFLWQAGKTTDLGTLGGKISQAHAINARGQVVGWSESRKARSGVGARSHAFVWEAGRMTDLGTLGGPISEAYAINDRGDVIGIAATGKQKRGSFVEHVFLWHDGTMTDIEPPSLGLRLGDLDNGSGPFALNNRGQVVTWRYCCGSAEAGFVSEDGSTTRLGGLSAKGWTRPAAISDQGVVVGSALASDGTYHPVSWQRKG